MSTANQQIITLYEISGMTPEEIATQFEWDIVAVKAVLMQGSSIYRKACKAEPEEESKVNFSTDDERDALDAIRNLMLYSEDENIKLKAAKYLRDDKKGRLDKVKEMKGLNFTVNLFNEQLRKARELGSLPQSNVAKIEETKPLDIEAKKIS